MKEKKQQLRKFLGEKQQTLADAYVREASRDIEAQLFSLPAYQDAKTIFLYVSMPKEPSTRSILQKALHDGKAAYVPKCLRDGNMLAVRIYGIEDLEPGTLGILEPMKCSETAEASELDLILVPCLAASSDGRRLGHGGGYYDRFLVDHSDHAVCLCFREMLCEDIPLEEHDIRMAAVISEHWGNFHRL